MKSKRRVNIIEPLSGVYKCLKMQQELFSSKKLHSALLHIFHSPVAHPVVKTVNTPEYLGLDKWQYLAAVPQHTL